MPGGVESNRSDIGITAAHVLSSEVLACLSIQGYKFYRMCGVYVDLYINVRNICDTNNPGNLIQLVKWKTATTNKLHMSFLELVSYFEY
jgi:hypothetical protein